MFLLDVDWLVKKFTEEKRETFTNASEEIYFAYDISLLSHTQKHICRKRQARFRRKATNLSLRSIKVNKKIKKNITTTAVIENKSTIMKEEMDTFC